MFPAGLSLFILLLLLTGRFSEPPYPRHLEEIAYDRASGKMLLFGGAEFRENGFTEPGDIYEWNGRSWKKIQESGPVGRRGHGWTHNETTGETFLFGGVTEGRVNKDSMINDVWSWKKYKWNRMGNTCPVNIPETVWDPIGERILVYGEKITGTAPEENAEVDYELWQYKNNSWKKLSDEGPGIDGSRMIAFDSKRKKLIVPVFSEYQLTVWEWSAGGWEKTPCSGNCPGVRSKFAIAYDPSEELIYFFGGITRDKKQLGDCWSWNGREWRETISSGGPGPRNSAHLIYAKGQMILFGGSVPDKDKPGSIRAGNELWSLKKGKWQYLNQ